MTRLPGGKLEATGHQDDHTDRDRYGARQLWLPHLDRRQRDTQRKSGQSEHGPDEGARTIGRGALGVFLLVVLSTFPVAVPFIFMHNVAAAQGVSNFIANVMLFLTGYRLGRAISPHPVWVGIAMLILGVLLVALNEMLGG